MRNSLRIVLVGDKVQATHLEQLLQLTRVPHEIICTLTTEKEARSFYGLQMHFDLAILDTDWEKGMALSIWETLGINTPIIICSKNEKYALTAFNHNCIDYLIMPIPPKRLKAALEKYSIIMQTRMESLLFSSRVSTTPLYTDKYKKRFLVRKDQELQLIGIGAVLCFYSDSGRSFLVAQSGKQFAIDFTLERLEELLDPKQFFRISRKVMVSIDQINSIEDHFNNRLKIKLHHKAPIELIVSRKRVKGFKQWLRGVV